MQVSILICTKNRRSDLELTLNKISYLIDNLTVECVVFDDGSTDGTYKFVVENYPNINVIRNEVSKGYLFCRNKMLNDSKALYAISLDDDAHFVTEFPIKKISTYFENTPQCGLITFRIFWGITLPSATKTNEKAQRVQGYVGCGHVWRMKSWHNIPNYPEWFVFYGEENFASYHLFKKNWEIHYVPDVLVHHRVDLKARKKNKDYMLRLKRSLRSGWYLYFLFYPSRLVPRKMAYSIFMQFKLKVLKGDYRALVAICWALINLLLAIPKILKNRNRFTQQELDNYEKISLTKIYWNP
ncbi:glycosyltransferase [Flavobacterium sp. XN-5]|uniref:glycosyltransferase n=1 Tax=Flavobacterium sp. XN-5 TaxID=2599390 RepID=UPI0011C99BBC|nr:glycosyltransferase [Flavobacterium sp. XN-5]NGY37456.1 glycosyltransferase [Flavobacterium sp. XN-5]